MAFKAIIGGFLTKLFYCIKEKPPEGGSDYFLLVKKVSVPKR